MAWESRGLISTAICEDEERVQNLIVWRIGHGTPLCKQLGWIALALCHLLDLGPSTWINQNPAGAQVACPKLWAGSREVLGKHVAILNRQVGLYPGDIERAIAGARVARPVFRRVCHVCRYRMPSQYPRRHLYPAGRLGTRPLSCTSELQSCL